MPISSERLANDLAAIAAATETPGQGATRPTFTDAWAQGRRLRGRRGPRVRLHGAQRRRGQRASAPFRSRTGKLSLAERLASRHRPAWRRLRRSRRRAGPLGSPASRARGRSIRSAARSRSSLPKRKGRRSVSAWSAAGRGWERLAASNSVSCETRLDRAISKPAARHGVRPDRLRRGSNRRDPISRVH